MRRKLSIAHLTAIELDPPALIEAAGAAGFDAVGLRLVRVTPESPGYPLSARSELAKTRRAMAATGVEVSDIEFLRLTPDFRLEDVLPALETGALLGARHVIAAPYDPDLTRLSASLAALAAAAAERGMRAVLEFFPWTPVPDLATCWQVVAAAGPLPGILVDPLHFERSGSRLADIARIPAERFPFAHFCDAPVKPHYSEAELLDAARRLRLAPGQGGIALEPLLRALPPGLPLGLEVPGALAAAETPVAALALLREAAEAVCARADALC
ncbi:sugar phosphate isomerase/epimerase [Poseidonocella sp. HB161398]|uniref:sugar phosphate isomerase/epimerase family protein n=1 Tax=Poseidonocella sp. HB161398 TaxID=2320855 RepID=UPI001107D67D|nr:TIM barrel protein [Poseidonocella sp. HB161398]